MKNLLIFCMAVDEEHVTLGFFLKWIAALAKNFDKVHVVAMYKGKYALPDNVIVHSVGKEKGYWEIVRFFNFYRIVWGILRKNKIDVVFTHMITVFTVLFWPLSVLFKIKDLMWVAHGQVTFLLRLSDLLVNKAISSTPEGYRIRSNKVTFIGQGIDVDRFIPAKRDLQRETLHLITVSRLSPVKHIDEMIKTILQDNPALLQPYRKISFVIIGGPATEQEQKYVASLKVLCQGLPEQINIEFAGRLPEQGIIPRLQQADIFINLSSTGSLDKAILEAMACGCLVVSRNQAFAEIARKHKLNELVIDQNNPLNKVLVRTAGLGLPERQAYQQALRDIVVNEHSFKLLVQKITELLYTLA